MTDRADMEREFWQDRADAWDRRVEWIDRFSAGFGRAAMDAARIGPGDRVIDIGCGPGTTVLELADRVGAKGAVTGLDIAPGMIDGARRRSAAAGTTNARFVVHDLGTAPLDDPADVAFSRFGLMFFPDPGAAFANIRGSLRSGGRLGAVIWGPLGENPWMFVPTLAAAGPLGAELALPAPGEPGPFSLADPGALESRLEAAGFVEVAVEPRSGAMVLTEAAVAEEVGSALEIGPLGAAWLDATVDQREEAVGAVIQGLSPFHTDEGWDVPALALVASATRPPA